MTTIAISSGHNRNTGARAVDGTDEWTHNEKLRTLLSAELIRKGFNVLNLERDSELGYSTAMCKLARQMKVAGADLCLELHFNSATPAAHGYEFLYYASSKGGKSLAKYLSSEYSKATDNAFTARRGTGILPRGRFSRGSTYLRVTPCPAIIVETGFASNAQEWRKLKNTLGEQAEGIANGVERFLNE